MLEGIPPEKHTTQVSYQDNVLLVIQRYPPRPCNHCDKVVWWMPWFILYNRLYTLELVESPSLSAL